MFKKMLRGSKKSLGVVLAIAVLAVSMFSVLSLVNFSAIAAPDAIDTWDASYDRDWEGEGTAEKPYIIYTAEEFMGIVRAETSYTDPNGGEVKYYKVADGVRVFDFTGTSPNGTAIFSGVLDGNGVTIKNYTDTNAYGNHGMFYSLDGATFKNICIDGADFTTTAGVNGGVFTGSIINNSVKPITFDNVAVINCKVSVGGNSFAGAFIGAPYMYPATVAAPLSFNNCLSLNNNLIGNGAIGAFTCYSPATPDGTMHTLTNSVAIGSPAYNFVGGSADTCKNVYFDSNTTEWWPATATKLSAGTSIKGIDAKTAMSNLEWGSKWFAVVDDYPTLAVFHNIVSTIEGNTLKTYCDDDGCELIGEEIELDLNNLALSAVASASGTANGSAASNVNDGNPATNWSNTDTLPAWVQLSWTDAITIDTLTIAELEGISGYNADQFTVSVSKNGTDFTNVCTVNEIGELKTIKLPKQYTVTDLRITFNSVLSGATTNPAIKEISVYRNYALGEDNLARFAVPTAISQFISTSYNLVVSNINDGNLNSAHGVGDRWTTANSSASALPAWAQYEWSAPVTFDTINIYEWKAGTAFRTNEFTLSTSDDGVNFDVIYTGNGIGEKKVVEFSTPVTTKYLRFTMNSVISGTTDAPAINEIEVFYNDADASIKHFSIDGLNVIEDFENSTFTIKTDSAQTVYTPTITVADGATYTPTGAQDFSNPVIYTVTAKDGVTTKQYTVQFLSIQYITDSMLSDNGSSDVAAYGPTPSIYQYEYQKQEIAAFLHFGMNTMTGQEWGTGDESPSDFNLITKVDFDSYVKTLKDAGIQKIVYTVKHHDGFCMWDTQYTEHNVMNSPYGADVLAELSEACTKYDMDMGIYLSPWDRNAESYGYYDSNGNPCDESQDALDYNEYYKNQLIEIVTNPDYGNNGHIVEFWLDGAKGSGADAQRYTMADFVSVMYQYEGKAAGYEDNPIIFGTDHQTVFWIGNEAGVANEETYSTQNGGYYFADGRHTLSGLGPQVSYNGINCYTGTKGGNLWVVPESDAMITSGWFWGVNKAIPKTLEELRDMYLNTVGHNAVLLLNIPLNNKGKLDEAIANRVFEWTTNIKESFEDNNLLERSSVVISASEVKNNDIKFKPSNVADGNDDTYWATEDGTRTASMHIDLGINTVFDAITIEEAINYGQRIESFKVEYKNSAGEWVEFASGTTIGSKRVILNNPVKARELRITFTGMVSTDGTIANPVISHIGVYKVTDEFEIGSLASDGIDEYDSADTNVFTANGWDTVDETAAIGGTYLKGEAGDTLTATFNGSYAWLVGTVGDVQTKLSISVDNGTPQIITIDSQSVQNSVRIFETGTLADGQHTIEVSVVSGEAAIEGLYVLNNGGTGMLDFDTSSYTVNEDMYFDVKIVRKGGTSGTITAILQDNPGSAVQSSYYTTEGVKVTFADGVTEKIVQVRTKRYTEKTGTLSFKLAIVSDGTNNVVTGFNNPATVNIIDAESYSDGYLNAIQVTTLPTKTQYNIGDDLDLTGIVVMGDYASGDSRVLKSDQYTVECDDFDSLGNYTVTIKSVFDNKSTTFNVTVVEETTGGNTGDTGGTTGGSTGGTAGDSTGGSTGGNNDTTPNKPDTSTSPATSQNIGVLVSIICLAAIAGVIVNVVLCGRKRVTK